MTAEGSIPTATSGLPARTGRRIRSDRSGRTDQVGRILLFVKYVHAFFRQVPYVLNNFQPISIRILDEEVVYLSAHPAPVAARVAGG